MNDVPPEDGTPDRFRIPDEEDLAFAPGDIVVDTDADSPLENPAVVLGYRTDSDGDALPAWAAPIAALDGETVAEVNPEYDMNDPVVEVMFVRALEQDFGTRWVAWADESNGFADSILSFAHEWGIPLKTYDYPESRLAAHPEGLDAVK